MFCFGCACLIQDIQGWGFGQAIIVGAILSAALTSRCLTFQTTASPLFHLLVDTWKLDNCLGFRCLLVKVGLLGFLQFATIIMLWSPQFEDHPNQQSVALIRFFWVNFVENMRQALLCLVWCHMVVFLAIHLLIFQLLKAVTSSRARANFWTLHCATRKGQEIFEFELWKEKYFQDLFDNNNNPCDYSQNCTVYTVIVSNFWFWVGISEKKKGLHRTLHIPSSDTKAPAASHQNVAALLLATQNAPRFARPKNPGIPGNFPVVDGGVGFSWWDPGGWKKIKRIIDSCHIQRLMENHSWVSYDNSSTSQSKGAFKQRDFCPSFNMCSPVTNQVSHEILLRV